MPIYYSFLSGVFVSVAANLFTGVFGSDVLPAKTFTVLWSSAFALLSSILWSVVAITVDEARTMMFELAHIEVEKSEAESVAVKSFGTRALWSFIGALTLAALSLFTLASGWIETPKVPVVSQDAV